jgi:hypothetical protein
MTEAKTEPEKKQKHSAIQAFHPHRHVQRMAGIASLLVIGAACLVWVIQQVYQTNLQRIDSSKYQIVSLVTGQVYFGKLQNQTGEYLVLKSPYIEQAVQPQDKNEDGTAKATQTTILRVKDMVYGPQDSIAIKSSQVTFWQNLRDDSKLAQAIKAKE